MSTTPAPWVLGRTGRPSTLAIFRETPTARELVCAFADHTVTHADAQLMVAAPAFLALAKQYASECGDCNGTGTDLGTRTACMGCAEIRAVIAQAEGHRR